MKKKKKERDEKSKPVVKLAWTFNPLRSNLRSVLIIIFIGSLFCASVYWNFKDPFLCVLSMIIFVCSLNSVFFPTGYILEENEIIIKNMFYTQKFPWNRFRRYVQKGKGVFLSPYLEPCTMDNYRSIYLFCDKDKVTEVLNIVKEKLSCK
jgi:hypothetical protein